MKKTIAIITSLAFCLLATPFALRAQDSNPAPSPATGNSGCCDGGGDTHHKHHDSGKGDKPAPSPSPAQ
jgi:hypothetical protein